MAYCPECGTAHETGQPFCANCGTQLGGVITEVGQRWPRVPPRAPVSAMSIISFILGLMSLLGGPAVYFLFFLGPLLVGALAIIAGMFAHASAREKGLQADGLATAGIILGVLGTIWGLVLLISTRA